MATFHQSIDGIFDQVLFLKLLFARLGLRFTVGPSLDPSALNIMVEEFRPSVCDTVERFCRATGKRIAIILTEHLDYREGRLYSYNEPLFGADSNKDYISHADSVRRFAGLVQASHSSYCLFTLGDYPRLSGIETVLPRSKLERLPFPPLPMDRVARRVRREPSCDFVFTGTVTRFRQSILDTIGGEFSVTVGKVGFNYIARGKNYLAAVYALNIPQYIGWVWSSPMRILYGLTMGRLTISPFLQPASEIDRFALMPGELCLDYLRDMLAQANPETILGTIEAYQHFAEDGIRKSPIGRTFNEWALVEGMI